MHELLDSSPRHILSITKQERGMCLAGQTNIILWSWQWFPYSMTLDHTILWIHAGQENDSDRVIETKEVVQDCPDKSNAIDCPEISDVDNSDTTDSDSGADSENSKKVMCACYFKRYPFFHACLVLSITGALVAHYATHCCKVLVYTYICEWAVIGNNGFLQRGTSTVHGVMPWLLSWFFIESLGVLNHLKTAL